jgi:O-antigen/teichoic acid export membrane protein
VQNLKKDYVFNTIGGTFNSFLSLFLLIIVTRLNGIEESGLFSFAFGMSLTFFTIALLGGRTYQVSDINGQHKTEEYILLKLIATTICFLLALVFIIANQYDFVKGFLLLLLVTYKALDAIGDTYYGILQKGHKLYIVGKSQLYKSVAALITFLVADVLTHNLLLSTSAMLLSNLLILFSYDLVQAKQVEVVHFRTLITGSTPFRTVHQLLKDSKVLIVASLATFYFSFSQSLLTNLPRYFIEHICPQEQGVYGIIIVPGTLIVLLMWFVLGPETVRISNFYAQSDWVSLHRIVRRIVAVTLAVGICSLGLTKLLAGVVFSAVYHFDLNANTDQIVLVVAAGILFALAMVYAQVLLIGREFKWQIIGYTLVLGVQLGLTFALTANSGLWGALWAYFFTNFGLVTLFYCGYRLKIRSA